ncbi:MAG TPA: response regulator [Blastocatellia bacterium]|nr:response regulator [Blastocatellia bacterium]
MEKQAILVVEDTPDILDVVCLLLEQEGYTAHRAATCSQAFGLLQQHRIDLIITDLMLPEMTGLEFIHKVRRVANYDFVPVVAMSAFEQKYLTVAAQAGATRILHKPEDLDLLVPTVNQLLQDRGSRFRQSTGAMT